MQAAVSPSTKNGTCVALLRLQLGFLHEELAHTVPGEADFSEHHQGGPESSLRPFTEP